MKIFLIDTKSKLVKNILHCQDIINSLCQGSNSQDEVIIFEFYIFIRYYIFILDLENLLLKISIFSIY